MFAIGLTESVGLMKEKVRICFRIKFSSVVTLNFYPLDFDVFVFFEK